MWRKFWRSFGEVFRGDIGDMEEALEEDLEKFLGVILEKIFVMATSCVGGVSD